MIKSQRKMVRELAEVRAELHRIREQLAALQADRMRINWSNLLSRIPGRPTSLVMPEFEPSNPAHKMGHRMFAHPDDFNDDDWLDEDEEDV